MALKDKFNCKYVFLLDTGASLNTVKAKAIRNRQVETKNVLWAKGISGPKFQTLGTVRLYVKPVIGRRKLVNDIFHVLPDKVSLKADGILGGPFLSKYKASISYKELELVYFCPETVKVPIFHFDEVRQLKVDPYSLAKITVYTNRSGEFLATLNLRDSKPVRQFVSPMNGAFDIYCYNASPIPIIQETCSVSFSDPGEHEILCFSVETDEVLTSGPETRMTKIMKNLKMAHVDEKRRQLITNLCAKYAVVFSVEGDKKTFCNLGSQRIVLKPDAKPVYTKQYRVAPKHRKFIAEQTQQLIDMGIAEPSVSPYNSPALAVPKDGGKELRLVIDLRRVNQQIQDDRFPIPQMVDVLDDLHGAKYFSKFDLSQGYYQIPLEPESRPLTAWTSDVGHTQLVAMPMGLKTSPAYFMRTMTIVFSSLRDCCFVYLDDIVVHSKSLKEHQADLDRVMKRLMEVNLKIKPSKCSFFQEEIEYLGHILFRGGVKPDPNKTSAVLKYPTPVNRDDVRRFVGFINYYRRFIENFAELALPLVRLLKKTVEFVWTEECIDAFELFKKLLVSDLILAYPDFAEPMILTTDASKYQLGCVLSNHDRKVVAYASRRLNDAEIRYPPIDKELLGIVWGIKHHRNYLWGNFFRVETDHQPLQYLMTQETPSVRLIKFNLFLQEFDFEIIYKKGVDNAVADALSRSLQSEILCLSSYAFIATLNVVQTRSAARAAEHSESDLIDDGDLESDQPEVIEVLKPPNKTLPKLVFFEFNEELFNYHDSELYKMQSNHVGVFRDIGVMLVRIPHMHMSSKSLCSLKKDLTKVCKKFEITEVLLLQSELGKMTGTMTEKRRVLSTICKDTPLRVLIVPSAMEVADPDVRTQILYDAHYSKTGGHFGRDKMFKTLKSQYYWKGMFEDVSNLVRSCAICQKSKHGRLPREPLTMTSTSTHTFEKIHLDLYGPLTMSNYGNKYVLTIQDDLSKFSLAFAMPNKEAVTVSKILLERVFCVFGFPMQIMHDGGLEFVNEVLRGICDILGVEQLVTAAYHHESMGAIENSHRRLGDYLRSYCGNTPNWEDWLPFYVFTYNTFVHESTSYSPFQLVFLKTPRAPQKLSSNTIDPIYNIDDYVKEMKFRLQTAHKDARDYQVNIKQVRKNLYDKKFVVNTKDFAVGDFVLIRSGAPHKLDSVYDGPHQIVSVDDSNVYVSIRNKLRKIHKNRVKLFRSN